MRRAPSLMSRGYWLISVLALALSACGGGGSNTTPTPPTLSRVEVTPAVVSRAAGTQQQYTAMAIFSDNSRQDVSTQVTWASSNTAVATISSTGLANALTVGQSNIGATYQGVSGSTTLTVTAATVTALAVTPSNPSIANGTTQPFTATATFSDNSTQNVTATAVWSSATGAVATISNASGSNGLASALSQGTSTIAASYQGLSASTVLTVTAATITGLAVTPPTPSAARGTTQQFVATASFTDGTTQNVTTGATWSSSTTTVATISNTAGSNGLAQAVDLGTATISAAYLGQTGSTTFAVTAATLVSIAVTPATASIANGLGLQFTAIGTYTDNSTQDLTTTATWSSSTTTVATISNAIGSQGFAQSTGQSAGLGTTTITAASGTISGTASLTVTAAVLSRVDVTPATPSVPRGLTQQFTATGIYTDNTRQDLTTTVTWSSTNTGAAAISNAAGSQGLAAANNPGSATIAATLGTVSGNTVITVTNAALSQIQVTPSSPSLARGFTRPFTATGLYTDNSTQDLTQQVTWASTGTGTATISNAADSRGVATGVAAGTTTITATQGTVNGSTRLTVTAATLSSIGVTPSSPSIANGLSQQFTAVGTFSDSSTLDLTTQVMWTSSSTSTAAISNATGSQGLASSTTPGSTTIGAVYTSGGSTITGTTVLTVTAATVVSIAVTPANPTIANGLTQQFTARGTFTDGTTPIITTLVVWSSSVAATATISNAAGSQGLATSASSGSTIITASYQGLSNATTLTVNAAALRSIAITPLAASAALGSKVQYAAVGTYTDNSTRDITREVTWASDTPAVATISNATGSNGLASTVSANQGQSSVTISATGDGGTTASTTLTVTPVALASISISPANQSAAAGTFQQFTATGVFSDSSTQDLTKQVTWSSSNPATADISNDAQAMTQGRAVANAAGAVQISATTTGSPAIRGSTGFTVTAATLTSIMVTPGPASTVAAGFRQQYRATGQYTDGTTPDITNQVSWSTLDGNVATISNAAADIGVLSAVAAGSTNVVAALNGTRSTVQVTVSRATLSSIAVTPAARSIVRGTSLQFLATGTFSDGNTLDLTQQATWASSSPNVATISNTAPTQGLATAGALTAGTTTISARTNTIIGTTTLRVTLN